MRIPKEGCWCAENHPSKIYRHARSDRHTWAFERWYPVRREWVHSPLKSEGPYIPCADPSKPEPRPRDAATRKWMRETGRELALAADSHLRHVRYRWSEDESCYQRWDGNRWDSFSMCDDSIACVPADGEAW